MKWGWNWSLVVLKALIVSNVAFAILPTILRLNILESIQNLFRKEIHKLQEFSNCWHIIGGKPKLNCISKSAKNTLRSGIYDQVDWKSFSFPHFYCEMPENPEMCKIPSGKKKLTWKSIRIPNGMPSLAFEFAQNQFFCLMIFLFNLSHVVWPSDVSWLKTSSHSSSTPS